MNVADYIRKKQKKENNNQNQNQQYQNGNPSPEEAMNKYSKMSEGDLMQELFKEGSVSQGKVSGEELDNFYNKVSGMIDADQRAKMKMLIEQLKRS
jgi:hypothetical protein